MTSQMDSKQLQYRYWQISQEVKAFNNDILSANRIQLEKYLPLKVMHKMWWRNYSQTVF